MNQRDILGDAIAYIKPYWASNANRCKSLIQNFYNNNLIQHDFVISANDNINSITSEISDLSFECKNTNGNFHLVKVINSLNKLHDILIKLYIQIQSGQSKNNSRVLFVNQLSKGSKRSQLKALDDISIIRNTIAQARSQIVSFSENARSDEGRDSIIEHLQRLNLPTEKQKVAPFQFFIKNGIIELNDSPITPKEKLGITASAIKSELIKTGQAACDALRFTQSDRVFTHAFDELLRHVIESSSIIVIGLHARQCSLYLSHYLRDNPDEFSPATIAILQHFSETAAEYVSLFEEWTIFQETVAADHAVEGESIQAITFMTQTLERTLFETDGASGQVISAISTLKSWLSDPTKVTQKVALAASRSLQNLYSAFITWISKEKGKLGEAIREESAKRLTDALFKMCRDGVKKFANSLPEGTLKSSLRFVVGLFEEDNVKKGS